MSSSYSTIHLAHPFKMTGQWWDATPSLRCCFWWDVFPGWCFPLRGETWSTLTSSGKYFEPNLGLVGSTTCSELVLFVSVSVNLRENLLAVNRWARKRVTGWVKISQVCRLQDFVKERQRWKLRVDEKEMLFKVADAAVGGFSSLAHDFWDSG